MKSHRGGSVQPPSTTESHARLVVVTRVVTIVEHLDLVEQVHRQLMTWLPLDGAGELFYWKPITTRQQQMRNNGRR